MPITAIIAEDEDLLRNDLVNALHEVWPELVIVGQAGDGAEALEQLAAHRPTFAFLDIRMPGLSGLDVAAALKEVSPDTHVVFVTAYQQYAIDAFEKGAVDYLLKPIQPSRLAESVSRLKQRTSAGLAAIDLSQVMAQLARGAGTPSRAPLTWITASAGRETKLIMVDEIAYFQADNKYTVVMTKDGEALIKKPIKELLDELDPQQFKQVHRSTIVNLREIRSIARDDAGRGAIRFKSCDQTVSVSQPFMHLFRNM
jgi:DNA-binding LytR/AlgR family response regulator